MFVSIPAMRFGLRCECPREPIVTNLHCVCSLFLPPYVLLKARCQTKSPSREFKRLTVSNPAMRFGLRCERPRALIVTNLPSPSTNKVSIAGDWMKSIACAVIRNVLIKHRLRRRSCSGVSCTNRKLKN